MSETLICGECGQSMRAKTFAEEIPSIADRPFANQPWEMATLIGYESPEGHNHDDNCLYRIYTCPDGHDKGVFLRRQCTACDWKGKQSCSCHNGLKVGEWPDSNIKEPGDSTTEGSAI